MEDLRAQIGDLEQCLRQEQRNRADERTGRTRAEKKLREELQRLHPSGVPDMSPIAIARSCFKDRRGTPRQGILPPH